MLLQISSKETLQVNHVTDFEVEEDDLIATCRWFFERRSQTYQSELLVEKFWWFLEVFEDIISLRKVTFQIAFSRWFGELETRWPGPSKSSLKYNYCDLSKESKSIHPRQFLWLLCSYQFKLNQDVFELSANMNQFDFFCIWQTSTTQNREICFWSLSIP